MTIPSYTGDLAPEVFSHEDGTRHNARGGNSTTPSGFTLIETIVVLVILGLALTIVAGFIPRRNTTLELSDATTRVAGAMRLARSRAMVESRPVPFATTPNRHGFRVDNTVVALRPEVTVEMAGPPTIIFAPDGSASGGALRVAVEGRQRLIRVDWLTGRVTVAAVP